MFSEALTYPKEGDDAVRTIGIGGLLSLFGFLLVPILPVFGYLLRVLDRTVDSDVDEPPAFDDWEELFVDGIKAFVVTFVYQLLPAVILFVFAGGSMLGILTGDSAAGALGLVGLFGGVMLAGLVSLVLFYVLPAGLVNMAQTGRIGSAFAFSELRPVLSDGDYATDWLMALGVLILAGVVTSLVGVVPFLGWIAGAFIGFYASVSAAYLWGRAVDDAGGFHERTEPSERGAAA